MYSTRFHNKQNYREIHFCLSRNCISHPVMDARELNHRIKGTVVPMRPLYRDLPNPNSPITPVVTESRVHSHAQFVGEEQDLDDEEIDSKEIDIEYNGTHYSETKSALHYTTLSEKVTRNCLCLGLIFVLVAAAAAASIIVALVIGGVYYQHGDDIASAMAFIVNMNARGTNQLDAAVVGLLTQLVPVAQANVGCTAREICLVLTVPLAAKLNITFDCDSIPDVITSECPVDLSAITFTDGPIVNTTVSASHVNSVLFDNSNSSPEGFSTQVEQLNDVSISPPSSYHG